MPLVNDKGVMQSFDVAEQSRTQKLSISRQRRVPDPLGVIEEASRRHVYHIFNVGPWPQTVGCGSYGMYYIPGCPKDQEYVEAPQAVMGIKSEFTIKDEYQYDRLMTDGWKVAQEIVGIGRHRNQKQALTHYGIFASKNAVPTKEELFQARTLLHATCSAMVAEARNTQKTDPKLFSVIVKKEKHFVAAEVLGLSDEPWMVEQTPAERIKCRYCATMNDAEAVLCAKCTKPINMAKFKALEQADAEFMEEQPVRRGPGRPPKVRIEEE